MRRLEGSVAVITGAGRGIGRATAICLAKEGAKVMVNDLDREPAEEVRDQIIAAGGRAAAIGGNVTDRSFAGELIDAAELELGRIDTLINNAGVTSPAFTSDMTAEQWQHVIDVNLTGVFNCIQAVGRSFERTFDDNPTARCSGRVVNVTSVAGLRGTVGQPNYGAAKAGVIGLTMSVAREWGRMRATCNAVAFGAVETRMTEKIRTDERFREKYLAEILLKRYLDPDEAARTIAFLASPDADYITGHTLNVSGGMHVG